MFDRLFGGSLSTLEKGLNAAALRNEVISNNISNASTPGFKSSSVQFESILQDSMNPLSFRGKTTRDKHIEIGAKDVSGVSAAVVANNNTTMRADGNNVDVENEMVDLARNTIQYNALVRKISGQLLQLKSAIRGQ